MTNDATWRTHSRPIPDAAHGVEQAAAKVGSLIDDLRSRGVDLEFELFGQKKTIHVSLGKP